MFGHCFSFHGIWPQWERSSKSDAIGTAANLPAPAHARTVAVRPRPLLWQ
jgi:hypothetical protein